MEILKTTDYSQFKIVMANREVDKAHVKRLANSIKRKNLLSVRPLIVNERMEVIDGQHRLAACELIDAPVYYITAEGLAKEDIAVLNTAQKNWTRLDFINFYAIEGRGEYKELAKLINKYPEFKVSMLIRAVGECKGLREGNISITNLPRISAACDQIRELKKKGKFKFVLERNFGIAFIEVVKSTQEFDVLLRSITEHNFYKCDSDPEYKRMLKSIFNSYN